jgi:phosphoserine phosphatase
MNYFQLGLSSYRARSFPNRPGLSTSDTPLTLNEIAMPAPANAAAANQIPLAVDLDGTLIRSDMMWESLAKLLREKPFITLAVPFWWLRGRAFLKQQVAAQVQVDVTTLPYTEDFLHWLREEKRSGRKLVLATASDLKMAEPIARHIRLFDEILASDGEINLRDEAKLAALTQKFGERGFDYAGNSSVDLDVWKGSRQAVVVNANAALVQRAEQLTKIGKVFLNPGVSLNHLITCLRPQRWIKNLIVFIPLLIAQKFGDRIAFTNSVIAFIAFCLCASATYLLDDLFDLTEDRRHATRRNRAFASGQLPLQFALFGAPVLLIAAMGLGCAVSLPLAVLLLGYFILAAAYSRGLKRIVWLNILLIAAFYVARFVAGQIAAHTP